MVVIRIYLVNQGNKKVVYFVSVDHFVVVPTIEQQDSKFRNPLGTLRDPHFERLGTALFCRPARDVVYTL